VTIPAKGRKKAEHFYLVPASKAKELKLVGDGANAALTLPHPDECAKEPTHEYYPFLVPRARA
jgi:hypothetical protein